MSASGKFESNGDARDVTLDVDGITLEGSLAIPGRAQGLVLFAHGSGSSRHSPRNRYVAQTLETQGIGTLLFDLLTGQEEAIDQDSGVLRFAIPFLAKRLLGATRWVQKNPKTSQFKIGYFGASTGAAAALVAAAEIPEAISAVVSRGGRPDLAEDSLGSVRAPTLLIVGGSDGAVIEMNREAMTRLRLCEKKLIIIPGATHLFEEPGSLEEVARVAAIWFRRHFVAEEKALTQGLKSRAS